MIILMFVKNTTNWTTSGAFVPCESRLCVLFALTTEEGRQLQWGSVTPHLQRTQLMSLRNEARAEDEGPKRELTKPNRFPMSETDERLQQKEKGRLL